MVYTPARERAVCSLQLKGLRTRSQEVDHKVAFANVHDALRLEVSNLQALCVPCHRRKTTRSSGA